ncbi:MAG: flagellar hook-basal body complex protein FliE [Pirellulales bacterium]|nr:flagellar hook-basal body complex protein FliE [Pirellulales bacterium]
MNPITSTRIPAPSAPLPSTGTGKIEDGSSFKSFLLESIQEVNSMQQEADHAVEQLVSGGDDVSPAEVLTAVQKADIAFRMMMQIRNKMVQAYQEVQNIRI